MFLQVATANGKEFLEVLGSFLKDIVRWSSERGDSDMAVGGLSLSLSIAYIVEMVFLTILLNSKSKVITWGETILPALKKLLNTGLMCIGMYFVFKLFDFQLDTTRTISIVILTVVTMSYGILSYWLGSKVFKVKEVNLIDNLVEDVKNNLFKNRESNETL
jgi:hypothetical protein